MPRYKVNAPGFYEGKFYDPEGKRKVLDIDKPFTKKNKIPSWLSEMPKESATLKEKREAYEKAQAELNELKAKQDKEDINNASTEGNNEETSFLGKDATSGSNGGNVETI